MRSHQMLFQFVRTGVGVFLWLFVFYYFNARVGTHPALIQSIELYLLSSIVACLAAPLAGHTIRYGLKRTIALSLFTCVCALLFLAGTIGGYFGAVYHIGFLAFALLFGIYSATYWLPYAHSGRLTDMAALGIGLLPLIVGVCVAVSASNIPLILFTGALVAACSIALLSQMEERYELFSWTYRQTFGELFNRVYRRAVTNAFAEGIESGASYFVWPIVIFLLLGQSFLLVGAATSLLLVLAPSLRVLSGRVTGGGVPTRRPIRALIRASSWMFRLSATSFIGIVLVDAYATLSSEKYLESGFTREVRGDAAVFVDGYTIVKDMATSLGRITAIFLFWLLLTVFSVWTSVVATFGLAALASLLIYSSAGAEEPFGY